MYIGITEQGDAGIDLGWVSKMPYVDGAILITKEITDSFVEHLLNYKDKCILHCTCTGWGDTWLEPHVPSYEKQLGMLQKLLDKGFPADHVVLRIDPIIPTDEGINRMCSVLDYVIKYKLPIERFRISIYDAYPHTRIRIVEAGRVPFYGMSFNPPIMAVKQLSLVLGDYPFTFETCAEDQLASATHNCISQGCISKRDLEILNLPTDTCLDENPQHRRGCHCLSCKQEMLSNRSRCAHGCLYCYWKG